ncbi:MAG: hypothetical protein CMLOHMNK_01531 [Steroidobacteraceae bacterium]|nr:hypothetical protein [Steroidobacteraceae bacterium]
MLYPFKLDLTRSRVLRIEMDEPAFRAASFLDDRILTPATKGGWLPLQDFVAAPAGPGPRWPLHFIFHTGHVGSTLVSRLLDEHRGVLSLREPLPLRTLAEAHDALTVAQARTMAPPPLSADQFAALLARLLDAWRRGFEGTQAVIVKATSSSARLAPALLDAAPDARAIYLNLAPEPYLATMLAGENSPIDLRGHAPERLRRLAMQRYSPLPTFDTLSPGELAAIGWLAETSTQHEVLSRFPGRVLAVDFEAFLADVPGQLHEVLAQFGLRPEPAFPTRVMQSPVLTRYSKAPEHPYDPALRAAVLHDSRQRNRGEILKGLRLLETLAPRDERHR